MEFHKTDPKITADLILKLWAKMDEAHPIFGKVGKRRELHPGGQRYLGEGKPMDVPFEKMGAEIHVEGDAVKQCDIETFATRLFEFAEAREKNIMESFIKNMNLITDYTGNVFDNKGAPASVDNLIEMFDKMEIPFNRDGTPKLPSMLTSPSMQESLKSVMSSEEFKIRFEKVIQKKRNEYYASICHRRLSPVDY